MRFVEDTEAHDEPDGGWVVAPALLDTVITSLVLCRFSGLQVSVGGPAGGCEHRRLGRHVDVECSSLYFQAEALASGTIDQTLFPAAQEVVRAHAAGDEPIGTTH